MKKLGGSEEVVKLTPREFLYHVEFGIDELSSRRLRKIVIEGDLVISENHELLKIPEAEVRGIVSIKRCTSLVSCTLKVRGGLWIEDCPSFLKIRGGASEARIERVGLEAVGADFETEGDLTVVDCPKFSKINCHVGGNLIVSGSPKLRAGPAFSCGKTAMIDGVCSKGQMGLHAGHATLDASGVYNSRGAGDGWGSK